MPTKDERVKIWYRTSELERQKLKVVAAHQNLSVSDFTAMVMSLVVTKYLEKINAEAEVARTP